MEKFITHSGKMALLNRGNIDTDQIISKEFLKSIQRTGFGEALFHHWRYQGNKLDPSFSLNLPEVQGASILVTGNNFGCGSSREHAVWAILQYGFKVVIAPRITKNNSTIPAFAEIFASNSEKNGLLLIELAASVWQNLVSQLETKPGTQGIVDLSAQNISVAGKTIHFDIAPTLKEKLLDGLDDIALTEKYLGEIARFEAKHDTQILISPS